MCLGRLLLLEIREGVNSTWLEFSKSPRSNPSHLEGRLDFPKSPRCNPLPVGGPLGYLKPSKVHGGGSRHKGGRGGVQKVTLVLRADYGRGLRRTQEPNIPMAPHFPPTCCTFGGSLGPCGLFQKSNRPSRRGEWTLAFSESPIDPLGGEGWTLDF